ncbi:MAG: EamA family transporter [Gammaproteobacteria bacterium]|nr:EamA family transporter [Gammaproteobacteria bacterium]MBI5616604.1 EamA family transporter [Gammaproteobacteria bacterium]
MGYFYVLLTVLLTVYGQIVIKWQVVQAGALPDGLERIRFLALLLVNPWVASGFLAAILAGLSWMIAMTKLELSHAYPFVSLSFALVLFFSWLVLHEPLTWPKVLGIGFIMCGVIVSSQG